MESVTTNETAGERATADRPPVTVIGLGEMGSALAGAYLDAGHPTTVWNRSHERAAPLVDRGAVAATSPAEAAAASPVVIVNVAGAAAAQAVVAAMGDVVAGRVVVDLTDGTTDDAHRTAALVAGRGGAYLRGQIMTIAPGVGQPEAVVFYGGPEELFAAHRPTLEVIGGGATWLGADVGLPSLHGMAMHGLMWATLNGFLHGVALLGTAGVSAQGFLPHAQAMLGAIGSLLPQMAEEVDQGSYQAEYGDLSRHLPSVQHLVQESLARDVDAELPATTQSMVEVALSHGHRGDSYARIVEQFRRPPVWAAPVATADRPVPSDPADAA